MDERDEKILKYNKINVEKQYWIDTYGKIHKYTGDLSTLIVSIHPEIAYELFPDISKPCKYLESIGWILVGSTVYSDPIICKIPTQSQINTLDRLNLLSKLCILDNGHYINFMDSEYCNC